MNSTRPTTQLDAVIIGAGIAGLYQLYRLREQGLKVKAVEAGDNVGGTWYWNRYPGARVDSQSHVYQYWFSKELNDEWNWSERFPAQPETERYLNFVADRFDLRKDIQFKTRVTAASYDEATKRWSLITDKDETFQAQYFISCAGMLSAPLMVHRSPGRTSSRAGSSTPRVGPEEPVDCTGKRVGVIGTAATGIQVIQTIASQVDQLKVFQRTPAIRDPDEEPQADRRGSGVLQEAIQRVAPPRDENVRRLRLRLHVRQVGRSVARGATSGSGRDVGRRLVELLGRFVPRVVLRSSRSTRRSPPSCATRCARASRTRRWPRSSFPPTYGFGTKRVPLETKYFEAFNRDNVELVDVNETPIERLTERGVRTADGKVREIDILVLATGFDAGTGALTRIDIRGRGGRSLKDEWSKEIRTTLGLQIHGYPNLFTTGAPLAPAAALCNMTTCLQHQVDWITGCIGYLRAHGLTRSSRPSRRRTNGSSYHDDIANATLIVKTDSWYVGSNVAGKQRRMLSFAGGVGTYHQKCEELAIRGYPGFAMS